MRISAAEKKEIIAAIVNCLESQDIELRLYGSRIDDRAVGGDIDLLLVVNNEKYAGALQKKVEMLVKIKDKIGDQKIDLLITSRDKLKTDNFIQLILPTSIVLYPAS